MGYDLLGPQPLDQLSASSMRGTRSCRVMPKASYSTAIADADAEHDAALRHHVEAWRCPRRPGTGLRSASNRRTDRQRSTIVPVSAARRDSSGTLCNDR